MLAAEWPLRLFLRETGAKPANSPGRQSFPPTQPRQLLIFSRPLPHDFILANNGLATLSSSLASTLDPYPYIPAKAMGGGNFGSMIDHPLRMTVVYISQS
jgi:hypothetical protein